MFLSLPSVQLALQRIASRVRQGGHDVPKSDVIRRFGRSSKNFHALYRPLADAWAIYDNSGAAPRLLERVHEEKAADGKHAICTERRTRTPSGCQGGSENRQDVWDADLRVGRRQGGGKETLSIRAIARQAFLAHLRGYMNPCLYQNSIAHMLPCSATPRKLTQLASDSSLSPYC